MNKYTNKLKIEYTDDIPDIELHYGLLENGKVIKAGKFSQEKLKRKRRKDKKKFERERLNWEDR